MSLLLRQPAGRSNYYYERDYDSAQALDAEADFFNPAGPRPALVQRNSFGFLCVFVGSTPTAITWGLCTPTLSGNCLVLVLDYDHGVTVSSITDNTSSSWSTTPAVSSDAGSGGNKTEFYVLPNCNSGIQTLTITFSTGEGNCHLQVLEFRNIATSSPVGATSTSITPKAPAVAGPALTPAAGSLVLHYAIDNTNQLGETSGQLTGLTAGPGWTLEAGSFNQGTTAGAIPPSDQSWFGMQTAISDGTSIIPRFTATGGTQTVNSIAMELKGASAGTAPTGIWIKRFQCFLNTNINKATWTEPFPCEGPCVVGIENNGNIHSAPTDSNGSTWAIPVVGVTNNNSALFYANGGLLAGSSLTINWPISNTPANTNVQMYDLAGADRTRAYVQAVSAGPTGGNGSISNMPSITPQRKNGVMLAFVGAGIGPILSVTAPTGALFQSTAYTAKTDGSSDDNGDGFATAYYGTSLSAQSWSYTCAAGANTFYGVAGEFAVEVLTQEEDSRPADATPTLKAQEDARQVTVW